MNEHVVTTRPVVLRYEGGLPVDGTMVPGSLVVKCSCGWNTVAIDDAQTMAAEYARRHVENPDKRSAPAFEWWMKG